MKCGTKGSLAVLAAGAWVNASEFFRNELLLKGFWTYHYKNMGLTFPSAPINGMVWVLWGFVFASTVFVVSRKFTLVQTIALVWVYGFVLMWLVTGNMGVLPFEILFYAIPLSLIEAFGAAYICWKVAPPRVCQALPA